MTVTAVRAIRGHQIALTLDDGSEVLVDKTVWEESPYGADSSLSVAQLEALCALSQRRRAENKAVFLLSKRSLSRRELEDKLCREKGRYHPERREAAAEAAAKMEELGYVDDEDYAAYLAERMARDKLYPRRRIVDELLRHGIDRELAAATAGALELDETEMALAFLRKKRYTVPQDRKDVQRIAGALARYGYSAEVIRRALRNWGDDLPDE